VLRDCPPAALPVTALLASEAEQDQSEVVERQGVTGVTLVVARGKSQDFD